MRAAYPIAGGDFLAGGNATKALKALLVQLGVDGPLLRRAMVAAYEAEMNAVIHAHGGAMEIALTPTHLEVLVRDTGPGIADVGKALQEGFSTATSEARDMGFGAGMGLPNILQNADAFSIHSELNEGTELRFTVELKSSEKHSFPAATIDIDATSCVHCFRCLHACPTQAIRVPENDTSILEHLCVDCLRCQEACPHAVFQMDLPKALPAPSTAQSLYLPSAFFHQFGPQYPPSHILRALEELGFESIYCSHHWEEKLMEALLIYAQHHQPSQITIAPLCPAISNLICTRFPSLLHCLAPFLSPEEAARERFTQGSLTVAPICPGQQALWEKPSTLSSIECCSLSALLEAVSELLRESEVAAAEERPFSPGLAAPYLSISGIRQVQAFLEGIEIGKFQHTGLVALYACEGGCLGAPVWPEFPTIAQQRLRQSVLPPAPQQPYPTSMRRPQALQPRPGMRLDSNITRAIQKLGEIDTLHRHLPGRDCGRCGAPSCLAHAEDCILNRSQSPCPFVHEEALH